MRASRNCPGRIVALAAGLALLLPYDGLAAEDDGTAKLREQLKTVTLALRDAQDQAAQVAAKNTELTNQVADLQKQLDAAKAGQAAGASSDQDLARAEDDLKQTQDQLAQAQAVLGKWQSAYNKAAEVARARDGAAIQAEAQVKRLKAAYDECGKKNAGLEKLGNDMIAQMGDRSFWSYLKEHEPVTGIWRVRLENLLQDDADRLYDEEVQQAKPVP